MPDDFTLLEQRHQAAGRGAPRIADRARHRCRVPAADRVRPPYFEAVLVEQFDAFVPFEETRAVTPLPAGRPQGAPDTHRYGL